MPRYRKGKDLKRWQTPRAASDAGKLRIVGGQYGGRQIAYSGDPVTRPMKDDIREAVFNLVGGWTPGKAAFDLFAGTGAMGLEAMSRGASRAYLIERHFPTVKIIRENVACTGPRNAGDGRRIRYVFLGPEIPQGLQPMAGRAMDRILLPALTICTLGKTRSLLELIRSFKDAAPDESLVVVESDQRFDVQQLPQHEAWSGSENIRLP